MVSNRADIEAGKEHIRKYVNTPEFKALQERNAEQNRQQADELTAACNNFYNAYKPLVENELKEVGFDLQCDDMAERFAILCDIIEVDPYTVGLGELYRKVRAWIQRTKIEKTIERVAIVSSNKNDEIAIPPERRTKPMSLADAGMLIKSKELRKSRKKAGEWLRRCIEDGTIKAIKMTRQSYVFDLKDFSENTHIKVKPK